MVSSVPWQSGQSSGSFPLLPFLLWGGGDSNSTDLCWRVQNCVCECVCVGVHGAKTRALFLPPSSSPEAWQVQGSLGTELFLSVAELKGILG